MNSILYLGIEGVLFRDHVHCHFSNRALRAASYLEPLPLLEPLVTVVASHDELCIVLNSWLVTDYGFRQVLHVLPQRIAEKTIGATMHGNRLHRRPIGYQARAEMLREDVHKRTPSEITIVDASHSAIPSEYNDRAIWVETTNINFAPRFEAKLSSLLRPSHPSFT